MAHSILFQNANADHKAIFCAMLEQNKIGCSGSTMNWKIEERTEYSNTKLYVPIETYLVYLAVNSKYSSNDMII